MLRQSGHDGLDKVVRHRRLLHSGKSGANGQRVIHIGPADLAGLQVGLDMVGLRRRQLPVHIRVQEGRKFLTNFHVQPPLSAPFDAEGKEKFPLCNKMFRNCFRPRLMRDFTVPTSKSSVWAISS